MAAFYFKRPWSQHEHFIKLGYLVYSKSIFYFAIFLSQRKRELNVLGGKDDIEKRNFDLIEEI